DESAFVLSPASWHKAPWWSKGQLENIQRLILSTKQYFNIDDDRVYLLGISDGGAGVFFIGTHLVDPFAGFISIIGHPGVLFNKRSYAREDVEFPPLQNMSTRPWYLINGAADKLYPVDTLDPYFHMFDKFQVDYVSRVQPGMGHGVKWNDLKDDVHSFVQDHPRTNVPRSLYWQTTPSAEYRRSHWLVIGRIDETAKQACVNARYSSENLARSQTLNFEISTEGVEQFT
ncbi:MAG: hypothetical protein GXP16_07365, partial [Gammaproteobacteria bacterium]|nr:hypothetical protein [Gammaproteobacteria bacterium]